ncbi:hypothetical protein J6590_066717 [Homalodisca vitripennis]|nr:hypothetical protein J6590_066717 [Homalodisca vitripennis]
MDWKLPANSDLSHPGCLSGGCTTPAELRLVHSFTFTADDAFRRHAGLMVCAAEAFRRQRPVMSLCQSVVTSDRLVSAIYKIGRLPQFFVDVPRSRSFKRYRSQRLGYNPLEWYEVRGHWKRVNNIRPGRERNQRKQTEPARRGRQLIVGLRSLYGLDTPPDISVSLQYCQTVMVSILPV